MKRVVIKKYENRRLYDTTNSRYVNLDEVAQMIRDGNEVTVLDAASGEDITRLILTQIVVEDAKAPGSVFPLDFLRQMIMASGRATQESALEYMKSMMSMYQNAFRAIPSGFNPLSYMSGFQPQAAPPPNGATQEPPPSARTAEASEVEELRKRIEELEAQVARRSSSAGTKRQPRKPTK